MQYKFKDTSPNLFGVNSRIKLQRTSSGVSDRLKVPENLTGSSDLSIRHIVIFRKALLDTSLIKASKKGNDGTFESLLFSKTFFSQGYLIVHKM